MRAHLLYPVVAIATLSSCGNKPDLPAPHADPAPPPAQQAKPSFAERRLAHPTKLVRHGPSPQPYEEQARPPGVDEVRYRSGDLELKAWYSHPTSGRAPALVYFHGGFAFGADDFAVVRPFLDAGFAVMTPWVRGENGNPGDFELYYGEVDDARAAVAWIRSRPDVDPERVFAFGHSAGGVLAALVSFYPGTGLKLTGSAGGLYDVSVLEDLAPFDLSDKEQALLRVPAPNGDQFRVPHIGYIGTGDELAHRGATTAARLAKQAGAPLTVEMIPGDHHSSLEPALQRFLVRLQDGLAGH